MYCREHDTGCGDRQVCLVRCMPSGFLTDFCSALGALLVVAGQPCWTIRRKFSLIEHRVLGLRVDEDLTPFKPYCILQREFYSGYKKYAQTILV